MIPVARAAYQSMELEVRCTRPLARYRSSAQDVLVAASGGAVAGARIPACKRFCLTTRYSGCGIESGRTGCFAWPAYVTRARAIEAPTLTTAAAPIASFAVWARRRAGASREDSASAGRAAGRIAARFRSFARARFDRLIGLLRA